MFGFLAQLLSWCYQVWPNYAGMVLLFTLIVMLVVTPFTVKGMRSAAEMSRLQPEMKKLQDQYKNDRVKQNEEMQALFKEHGVNPLGGCLPTLLPLPIFFIIFRLLERMNARRTGVFSPLLRLVRHNIGGPGGYVAPHYLAYKAPLTQAIVHSNGQLKAFGVDLAVTAGQHHATIAKAIPYYVLIVVMTASQYWQQRQINKRNPAAANANPQMKLTMQMFPAIYALISFRIPAAVVLYLLLSGLFRMAQNSISYRFDPVLARAATPPGKTIDAASRPKVGSGAAKEVGGAKAIGAAGKGAGSGSKAALTSGKAPAGRATAKGGRPNGGKAGVPPVPPKPPGGFMERLRAQAAEAKAQADQAREAKGSANSANGKRSEPVANGKGNASSKGGRRQVDEPIPVDDPIEMPVDGASWEHVEPPDVDADVVAGSYGDASRGSDLEGAGDDDESVGTDGFEESSGSGSGSGRPSASPLSIRPSGRRPKKGR